MHNFIKFPELLSICAIYPRICIHRLLYIIDFTEGDVVLKTKTKQSKQTNKKQKTKKKKKQNKTKQNETKQRP